MREIEFTQYVLPHGRARSVRISRPEPVSARADELRVKGFSFECEMLPDLKTVSLTISNGKEDVACEIADNGPAIPDAVDRLILGFRP